MDNWKQERYAQINKALERIQRRADKVKRAIEAVPDEDQGQQQRQQRVSNLTSELARLQDMNDRLFDFRDRLCFYSNLGYVESLNEWQYEIRKICVRAEGFEHHQSRHHKHHHHHHHHKHHHRQRSADGVHATTINTSHR
eukprot:g9711.t1